MRVGIVALNFRPGLIGGAETYLRNLVAALQRHDGGNEYVLVLPAGAGEALPLINPRFRLRLLPLGQGAFARLRRLAALGLAGRWRDSLARLVDGLGCDVLHFPLQVREPFAARAPAVVTCLDLQHEYLPAFFSRRELLARRLLHRESLLRARRVIAISDFVKATLAEKYGLADDVVTTIYPAGDEETPAAAGGAPAGLPERFFFYPAEAWPHKNHGRLLEAFGGLSRRHPEVGLVLSGITASRREKVEALVRGSGLEGRVLVLGRLPWAEVRALYRRALALVFPSLYEGFGLPVVEAMRAGCPVLCSREAALPEVAGEAAVYFDPRRSGQIDQAMEELLMRPGLRQELVAAGRRRAGRFCGRRLAEETIALYERCAGRRSEGSP